MGQWKIALRELGRPDPVVTELFQYLDPFFDGFEVDSVLEGEDGPVPRLGGKLSDEDKKRNEGECVSHEDGGFSGDDFLDDVNVHVGEAPFDTVVVIGRSWSRPSK